MELKPITYFDQAIGLTFDYYEPYEVDAYVAELNDRIDQLKADVANWKEKYRVCKQELDLLKDTYSFYRGSKI